jgi:hypothetical protein
MPHTSIYSAANSQRMNCFDDQQHDVSVKRQCGLPGGAGLQSLAAHQGCHWVDPRHVQASSSALCTLCAQHPGAHTCGLPAAQQQLHLGALLAASAPPPLRADPTTPTPVRRPPQLHQARLLHRHPQRNQNPLRSILRLEIIHAAFVAAAAAPPCGACGTSSSLRCCCQETPAASSRQAQHACGSVPRHQQATEPPQQRQRRWWWLGLWWKWWCSWWRW